MEIFVLNFLILGVRLTSILRYSILYLHPLRVLDFEIHDPKMFFGDKYAMQELGYE